jgi:hypothetical protein
MGEMRNACKILVVKSEGNSPLERPRCIEEDNIKINLKEKGGTRNGLNCFRTESSEVLL